MVTFGVALYQRLLSFWPVPIITSRVALREFCSLQADRFRWGGPGDHHTLLKGSKHASRLAVFVLIRKLTLWYLSLISKLLLITPTAQLGSLTSVTTSILPENGGYDRARYSSPLARTRGRVGLSWTYSAKLAQAPAFIKLCGWSIHRAPRTPGLAELLRVSAESKIARAERSQ